MCRFKKTSDEETDDEDTVEGIIFPDVNGHSSDDDSSSDGRAPEPSAGPSNDYADADYEPNEADEEEDSEDDEEQDDPLVESILAAKRRRRNHPPDIQFSADVTDLSFSPVSDQLAVGSMTGDIFLYHYEIEGCQLKQQWEVHTIACRALEFAEDATYIASCGVDKTLIVTDPETGKFRQFYDNAHEEAPSSLCILKKNLISTGDESGVIKVWDLRQKPAIATFKVGDEVITSMISDADNKYLVCTGGDCLTSYDMNTRKLFVQSESYDEELTCMGLFKNDSKLAVGCIKGTVRIFNWGQFGYHSDVYPGPKHNINTLLPLSDHFYVTGCGDGVLRAAHLFPHKQLGIVGQHKLSIEAADIDMDGEYIATCGLDETVKFWDIQYFENIVVKAEKTKKRDAQHNLPSSESRNAGEFFADLA